MVQSQERSERRPQEASSASTSNVADRVRSLRLDDRERRQSGGSGKYLRAILWLIMLALLGAGGSFGFEYWKKRAAEAPIEVEAITVATPDTGDATLLSLSGNLAPRRRVDISARLAGTVTALPVEVGARVKQGDLLLQMDDSGYRTDFEQAVATLAIAQAKFDEMQHGVLQEELDKARAARDQAQSQLALQEREFERAKQSGDAISPSMLDRFEQTVLQARAAVQNADIGLKILERGARAEHLAAAKAEIARTQALVDKAQNLLDQTRIVAPCDGTVLERNAELGELVRPEALGSSLFVIADLTEMEAETAIQERDLSKIQVGQPCRIIPEAYSDRSYEGRLERFTPQVNSQRGIIEARVKLLEPDEMLLAQMNCRIEFLRDGATQKDTTLRIPESAVQRDGDQAFAYVVEANIARKRTIATGAKENGQVAVTEGLSAGEVVLFGNLSQVSEGRGVKVRMSAPK